MAQLRFEVDSSCDVSNTNDIRTCYAPINMDEKDALNACLLTQLRVFLDMLSGNNAKTQDNFIDSGSKPVFWMCLKGIKSDGSAKRVE